MDASVAALVKASRDPLIAFHEFLMEYGKNDDRLFCFFEGKDDNSYYSPRISMRYLHYVCYGKGNVVHVYNRITRDVFYRNAKTAFFVDCDYEQALGIKGIFETPCYSIENMYSEGTCFKRVLEDHFLISRREPDYEKSVRLFEILQNTFHNQTGLLNAWLAHQSSNANVRLGLSDNKQLRAVMRDLVDQNLSLKQLDEIDSITKLEAMFPESVNIDLGTVNARLAELKRKGPKLYFRGKFELAFFHSFLVNFQKGIRSGKNNPLSKKYAANPTFSDNASEFLKLLSGSAASFTNLNNYMATRLYGEQAFSFKEWINNGITQIRKYIGV